MCLLSVVWVRVCACVCVHVCVHVRVCGCGPQLTLYAPCHLACVPLCMRERQAVSASVSVPLGTCAPQVTGTCSPPHNLVQVDTAPSKPRLKTVRGCALGCMRSFAPLSAPLPQLP